MLTCAQVEERLLDIQAEIQCISIQTKVQEFLKAEKPEGELLKVLYKLYDRWMYELLKADDALITSITSLSVMADGREYPELVKILNLIKGRKVLAPSVHEEDTNAVIILMAEYKIRAASTISFLAKINDLITECRVRLESERLVPVS